VVERLTHAFVETIHFLKTNRSGSITLLQRYFGGLSAEEAGYLYDEQADLLERSPAPNEKALKAVLERETDPKTTYRSFMTKYVDESRAIGATPILVTSLVRRIYNTNGTIKTTQTPYVEAVRALAAEKHVPLIDLHAISLADAENAGDDVWADLSPRDDKGDVDRTHLNAKGSDVVGRMVAEALRPSVPELGMLFRVAASR
jgi:hypothetical protein